MKSEFSMEILRALRFRLLCLGLVVVVAGFCQGCDKSSSGTSASDEEENVVALAGNDLKPDGTISAMGLQSIEKKAGEPKLQVVFVRSRIRDGALIQLAKYPNLRRIEAPGSPLTANAIKKLKSAIPEVEVEK
jgi:hypothetical protein